MAGKVGCGLLLAVLFCAAAVSRAPFVVFLLALAVVLAGLGSCAEQEEDEKPCKERQPQEKRCPPNRCAPARHLP